MQICEAALERCQWAETEISLVLWSIAMLTSHTFNLVHLMYYSMGKTCSECCQTPIPMHSQIESRVICCHVVNSHPAMPFHDWPVAGCLYLSEMACITTLVSLEEEIHIQVHGVTSVVPSH